MTRFILVAFCVLLAASHEAQAQTPTLAFNSVCLEITADLDAIKNRSTLDGRALQALGRLCEDGKMVDAEFRFSLANQKSECKFGEWVGQRITVLFDLLLRSKAWTSIDMGPIYVLDPIQWMG